MPRFSDKVIKICDMYIQSRLAISDPIYLVRWIKEDARRHKIFMTEEYGIFLAATVLRVRQKIRDREPWDILDMETALDCWIENELPESIERVRNI